MSSPRTPQADASGKASTARPVGVLLVLTALVFCPVLFADFIRLDDPSHLFNNPHLQRASWGGLLSLWSKPYFNLYIPMTYSAWWALSMVGGLTRQSAWLFHAFNLVVHLVNTALAFFLVRALLRLRQIPASPAVGRVALLAALLFALHPAQVETVAWVSELKGGLSMTFGLLGLLAHCRSDRPVLTGAFFLAAMLAKPSAIVFPGVAFLLNRIWLGKGLRQSVLIPAVQGVFLLPFMLWTKRLQPDLYLDVVPSFGQRLVVAADALVFYMRKVLLPYPLAVDYGRSPRFIVDQVPGWQLAFSGIVALAVLALVVWALVRPSPRLGAASAEDAWSSLLLCGCSTFLLSIAPVLGLVPFGFQQFSTVADHYLYLPLLGVGLMGAGLLLRLHASAHAPRLAVVLVLILGGLAFAQARQWRSTESLFARTLQVNPRSYLGAFSVGDEYLRGGQPEQSLPWLRRSLAINPDYLEAQISLGMALVQSGQIDAAIDHYNAAIARNPSTAGNRARSVASLHNNLGMLLLQGGREKEAAEQFHTAVRMHPSSVNAHLNLGNMAMVQGRYLDAMAEYEKALAPNPHNPGIRERFELARHRAQQIQTDPSN